MVHCVERRLRDDHLVTHAIQPKELAGRAVQDLPPGFEVSRSRDGDVVAGSLWVAAMNRPEQVPVGRVVRAGAGVEVGFVLIGEFSAYAPSVSDGLDREADRVARYECFDRGQCGFPHRLDRLTAMPRIG